MNRRVLALLLAIPVAACAKFSFGIDASFSLYDDIQTSDPTNLALELEKTKSTSVDITPRVGIYVGETVEISPFVLWGFDKNTYVREDTVGADTDNAWTQHHVGFGVGVYMHVVRGDVFGLSLGPQIGYQIYFRPSTEPDNGMNYDKYYNADLWLGVPINFDLHLSKHVTLRLGSNIFRFMYRTHSIEAEGREPDVGHVLDIDVRTIFQPSFGLNFVF